jgi:glycosyltransferase involved in cell wall biosynthesis
MHEINLLYVITKLELGGAQKQLLSLIKQLDKKKFKPFLFTTKEGLLLSEASAINGLTLKSSISFERALNPLKDLFALIEIYRFIKKNNIKVVHTHSSKAGILGRWAARLAGTEVIIHTVHGWSFNDYQPYLVRLLFVWLEKFTARFTDRIIVVSNHDKRKGIDSGIGQENKYALIRYGIDYAEFGINGQEAKKELGLNESDRLVCMISCFKPQKSPQDFVKLASLVNKTIPDAKFLLVGDGALRKKVERLTRKLDLQSRVLLSGWRRDIPKILSAIDVFALTSLWEGLPISVLEAMASSKPVVATNTGGVAEVITEGRTGFLVPPKNTAVMSEKLVVLLKDERLRKQMGENARESLNSEFSLSGMVKNSQNLYECLIKEKEAAYVN